MAISGVNGLPAEYQLLLQKSNQPVSSSQEASQILTQNQPKHKHDATTVGAAPATAASSATSSGLLSTVA